MFVQISKNPRVFFIYIIQACCCDVCVSNPRICIILSFQIETDRYDGEHVEDELCKLCSNYCVEEIVLYDCSLYNDFQSKLFDNNGCILMPQY